MKKEMRSSLSPTGESMKEVKSLAISSIHLFVSKMSPHPHWVCQEEGSIELFDHGF
jgi:hypothetical protein